jgi:DnaK suppressor protein
MDVRARAGVEASLRARREALLHEGDHELVEEVDTARKVDDDAAPLAEMEKVIASNRNRARAEELQQVEAALQRLAEDPEAFGICEQCEEAIPPRRIELMPWVRLCIDCQQVSEDDRPSAKRRHLTDYR